VCPSLAGKARHRTHLATHRRDAAAPRRDVTVIALWLGHEQIATTNFYLHADMTMKETAIANNTPPDAVVDRYQPPDRSRWTRVRKARSGIPLLTPAYLAGRFWTERELGALLGKSTLIPVLHNVSFDDVKEYSGILPDFAGFTTAHDSVAEIAEKIAAAIMVTA